MPRDSTETAARWQGVAVVWLGEEVNRGVTPERLEDPLAEWERVGSELGRPELDLGEGQGSVRLHRVSCAGGSQ